MSKHEKQVRRERKKTDRARRRGSLFPNPQSAIRNGGAALAAAAVIAAGTQAYASPVRYDNPAGPGHFEWFGGPPNDRIPLDITLDAASQTETWNSRSQFGQGAEPLNMSRVSGFDSTTGLQVSGPYGDMLTGVDSGDLIPSGLPWRDMGYIWYGGAGGYSYLPEGQATYLGVLFPLASTHYGWIGVVRTGMDLDAFAWGYETTPGVPIEAGVPEPNTLALLAFGAVAAIRKRRPA